MTGQIAETIAAPYLDGAAQDVRNPDGEDGIDIHIDMGVASCDQNGLNCSTVWGDWGGAGTSSFGSGSAENSALQDMAIGRRGVFFHALVTNDPNVGGSGGVNTWFFEANRNSPNVLAQVMAHELGHNLGVNHWGDPTDISSLICKPNYRSIMSYSIPGNALDVPAYAPYYGFSDGSQPSIVSTSLVENANPGLDLAFLEAFFGLETDEQAQPQTIDWNRDGTVSNTAVAAPTRWGVANDACQAGMIHITERAAQVLPGGIPALATINGTLHAFFPASNGTLRHTKLTSPVAPCLLDNVVVTSVSIATNTLTVGAGHPLQSGDEVTIAANPGGHLPGGLSPSATYFVVQRSSSTVKLSFSAGGPAIDLTAGFSGTNTIAHETQQPLACCTRKSNSINGCMAWSSPVTVQIPTGALSSSPSAVTVPTSSGERIALAYSVTTGTTRQMRIRRVDDVSSYGPEVTPTINVLQTSIQAAVDPSLVYLPSYIPNQRLHMYFLGPQNELNRVVFDDGFTTFTHSAPVTITSGGVAITSRFAPVAARYQPGSGGELALFLTGSVQSTGDIRLWANGGGFTGIELPGAFSAVGAANGGRPSMLQQFEVGTAIEVYFARASGELRRTWAPIGFAFLPDRNVYDGPTVRTGAGLSVYQGKLQMAAGCPPCLNSAGALQHLPFSTGVFPFIERDHNDFKTFGDTICSAVQSGASSSCSACSPPGTSCLIAPPTPVSCRW